MRYRSLPLIAVRRMAGNWRLLVSVAIGTVVAAAILSSTALYSEAIRDLGLDFALEHHDRADLDVHVGQTTVAVDATSYQRARARIDPVINSALGGAVDEHLRQASTATFFPTELGGAVSTSNDRPRAFLRFRSDIESHLVIVEGAWPDPVPEPSGAALPVAVGRETAERNGMSLGTQFELHPFWDDEATPLTVEVAAIVEARDLDDPFWGGDPEAIDRRTASWETYAFHVPEATLFGAVARLLPGIQADLADDYRVDLESLSARTATDVADGLEGAARTLGASESRLRLDTDLIEVLRTYDRKLFFTQVPLLILLLQIAGIVAYYLLMVSTMLVERQASEIALLRSRGATTGQLLAQYSVEALILAGLAVAVGPPLAALVISALGPTPAFEALSGGGFLEVRVSGTAYLLAVGGALIAFLALMVPAWRITRSTMVELRRQTARPRSTPFFLRYYLDVLFVLASALVLWQVSQREDLFTTSIFGDLQSEPLLLLMPAVFLLTVGVVFLRLFPLVLRGVSMLLSQTPSTAVLVGIRSLVRNPTHYTRLILLLMFATGVGMFGASFSRTLDQSYDDRAAYASGADVRATDLRGLPANGEFETRSALEGFGAEVASPVLRTTGNASTQAGGENVTVLGIEPSTFADVAFFRGDFASMSLAEVAATLEENDIESPGFPIEGAPTAIGAWVQAPTISGRVIVAVRVRDSRGVYADVELGVMRPEQPVTQGWTFAWAPLPGADDLRPPLELISYFIVPRGSIAASEGTVLLGGVMATEANLGDVNPEEPGAAAFAGAYAVTAFASVDGLTTLEGYRPTPSGDRFVADRSAPPGFDGSIRYSWVDARRGPPLRGLQLASDVRPMQAFLLDSTATALELEEGDLFQMLVGSRFVEARLVGTVELFPTVRTAGSTGLAVVNLDRLLYGINRVPGVRGTTPNEAWFATDDPASVVEALTAAGIGPDDIVDIDTERLAQQEDPLVAAGWQGILAIAFGAVLLLSAIGFLVYSYLTAQERALEFAILRTLGFSRLQVFGVVAFEQLFVIAAGMGLGTIVGLQVGRQMMGLLGTDEQGADVLPPFVLGVSWPSVFIAWAILGAVFAVTIGGVVLLYVRLQVHRALRIGDA
ncbi:MAG: FtsX-like permease family protein [Dehalococcoidia bacterium]